MEEQREDFEGTSNQRNWIPENFVASSLSSFTLIGHHYSEAKHTKIDTIITISTKISWVWWDEHWESQPCRHRWSSRSFSPLEQAIVRGKRYIIQDISYQLAPHTSHHNRLSCAIINAMMLYQKPTRLSWIAVSTSDTSEVNSAIATGSSGKVHWPALFAWHVCLCSWFGQ